LCFTIIKNKKKQKEKTGCYKVIGEASIISLLTNHKCTTMLTLEFSMNILILFAVIMSSLFIGFKFRSKQIAKNHSRVMQLESEMIHSHAEILELQKEYITMELKMRGIADPVIAMRNSPKIGGNEKSTDVSLRKKLLNKENSSLRNEGYQMIYDGLSKEPQRFAPDQY
jgi:hypothetical protein